MRTPKGAARSAVALATCPKPMKPIVWPISRGNLESIGRPSRHRASRTILSIVSNRRNEARIIIIVWSATSSMKVSGTLVTGIPRAVAAAMSTESAPTLPNEMTLQFSRASMISLVMGRPRAKMASASLAPAMNSASVLAGISTISASMGPRASISRS